MKNFFSFGKTLIPNDFATAQKTASDLGTYEKSEQKLAPKTFREQYEPLVSFVNFFAVLYPIASIITGLATIYLGASLFISGSSWVDYATFAVVLILGLIILFGNEKFKESTLEAFFHGKFNQNKVTYIFILPLIISIAFSSYGGLLLSQKSNDKTSDFVGFEKSAIDSVKNSYAMQLRNDSLLVADLGNSLAKEKSKWTKIALREQLDKAQSQYVKTKENISKEISSHAQKTEKSISSNQNSGLKIAIICAFIIAVFELVLVLCVWFSFWFASGCRTENRNFNFVDISHLTPIFDVQNTQTAAVPYAITAAVNTAASPNKVGFGIGTAGVTAGVGTAGVGTAGVTAKDGKSRVCLHCGNEYTYAIHNQKFCSENCRRENWNQKHGRNFTPRKK